MSKKDQKAYSDFNLQALNAKQLLSHLKASIEFGTNVGIFGRRGLGKTFLSKDAIEACNFKEVYLNLSVFERVDLGGYPKLLTADRDERYVNYLMPNFYESLIEGDQRVVLLLDEVDKADPSLFAPLLELTQFRTMNGRKLPNLQAVIMTGNLQAEGGQRPSLPLLDRAEKYFLDVNVEDWLTWAGDSQEIHPSVSAFIADHPKELFGDVDPGDVYADPSPRGWHNASKSLFYGDEHNWSDELMTKKVSGYVGKAAGVQYTIYFTHYRHILPKVAEIFEGKNPKDFNTLEPGAKMVCVMLACARLARIMDDSVEKANKANKDKAAESLNRVGKWLETHAQAEMVLIAARSQIGIERIIKHGLITHPNWSPIVKTLVRRVT